MKPEFEQISESVKQCYHISDNTCFEVETVDAHILLTSNRLDLSAKLYYIECYVEQKESELARQLYYKHLEVMECPMQEEKEAKSQMEESLDNFQYLIDTFRAGKEEEILVVAGAENIILDGTHFVACSIYFGRKVKMISFPEIEGERFDFKFFLENGLEHGYLELMAGIFAHYRKDCVGRYSLGESNRYRRLIDLQRAIEEAGCYMIYGKKIERDQEKGWYYIFYSNRRKKLTEEICKKHYKEIKTALDLEEKEKNQVVITSKEEELRCKKARNMRYRHMKYQMAIRKALHLPVKKNEEGYGYYKSSKK